MIGNVLNSIARVFNPDESKQTSILLFKVQIS